MLRRFYTVMIVPHGGGTLRRISISMNFLVSMTSIFMFCFVSSAFLAHFFLDGMHRIDEAERLRVQAQRLDVDNNRMRSELQLMVLKIEDLTDSLERYREVHPEGWPEAESSMGGGYPGEGDDLSRLSLDGDWRSTSRAAQDKAEFWIGQIREQLCDEEDEARARPSLWPVEGRVTSRLGWRRDPIDGSTEFHQGIDIAAPFGTEVFVAADGVVTEARRAGGYGNMVRVDHGNGLETVYGHLRRINVQAGQTLRRGACVGLVGSTGRSTGPHLHYEVRENGKPVCPIRNGYMPAAQAGLPQLRARR